MIHLFIDGYIVNFSSKKSQLNIHNDSFSCERWYRNKSYKNPKYIHFVDFFPPLISIDIYV